ncbi:MAG: hypothetical protein A2Z21_06220 [Candidatus Fraserbacteria bacterium RBG_16_55_9]|uniref:Blue (type 1) copper domain-containing protein n=1 Tax=Fraserbacteria sp. (strain RBG_16_55_9) TaxID=1817864 RepID=A0A1F5UZD8_FRAXR|nr:MAG: hypothetical protein A2Z21_06220 [Candidatus Fraserbacteria bacterium RBG_16_55_9]
MNHKQVTRRHLFKTAGVVALSGAALQLGMGASALAQKDPTTADLEIRIGEFYFQVAGKDKNAPIELEAGKELLIKFVNEGSILHEAHFGRTADLATRRYQEELMPGFLGLHLAPQQQASVHLLVPSDRKGEWEIGCLITGHYEAGQKTKLVIK